MTETSLRSKADVFDDSFEVASSPESLRQLSVNAPLITDQAIDSDDHEHQDETDSGTEDGYGRLDAALNPTQSTRTSISSFPASVVHNDSYLEPDPFGLRTPSKSHSRRSDQQHRADSPGFEKRSPGLAYINGFRNPSSVRAMQMCESEYDDGDDITPSHRRKNSRLSHFSYRSSTSLHSSPKRTSRSNTPHRQTNSGSKLKKEFPLVLLHCTLLPPAITAYGHLVTDEVLEAVLPETYRKRWRTLQDKIVKNSEVKHRGVLIPHPRDDYDLLEERLLESLELQRPRIRQNHYLGGNDNDSGFESASSQTDSATSDTEDDEQTSGLNQKCPDCGKHVTLREPEQERKWEVKVYAANGLMRGGAWAAAWSEMEKVDVEVGVWMPEEIRREVESRLALLQEKHDEFEADTHAQTPSQIKTSGGQFNDRMREIYGNSNTSTQSRRQEEIDGLDDKDSATNISSPSTPGTTDVRDFAHMPSQRRRPSPPSPEPELSWMIQRRIQHLFQDQRNIAIVLLSALVLFFAISAAPRQGTVTPPALPSATSIDQGNILTSTTTVSHTQPHIVYTSVAEHHSVVTTTINAELSAEAQASDVSEEIPYDSAVLAATIQGQVEGDPPSTAADVTSTSEETTLVSDVEAVPVPTKDHEDHQEPEITAADAISISSAASSSPSAESTDTVEPSSESAELGEEIPSSEEQDNEEHDVNPLFE